MSMSTPPALTPILSSEREREQDELLSREPATALSLFSLSRSRERAGVRAGGVLMLMLPHSDPSSRRSPAAASG